MTTHIRTQATHTTNSLVRLPNSRRPRPPAIRLRRKHSRRQSSQRISPRPRYINTTRSLRRPNPNRLLSRAPMSQRRTHIISTSSVTRRTTRNTTRSNNRTGTPSLLNSNTLLLTNTSVRTRRYLHAFRNPYLHKVSSMSQDLTLIRRSLSHLVSQHNRVFRLRQRQPFPANSRHH